MRDALPPGDGAVTWHVDRSAGVVTLAGEIDEDNAAMVTDCLVAEISAGAGRLDLSGVSFISAAGVRALLTGHGALRPGDPELRVTCSPIVLRVMVICGLGETPRMRLVAADRAHHPTVAR